MIDEDKAISIAKGELAKSGYSLATLDITVDREQSNDKHWMIWFEETRPFPVPGGHGFVRVDKRTGAAVIMRGE